LDQPSVTEKPEHDATRKRQHERGQDTLHIEHEPRQQRGWHSQRVKADDADDPSDNRLVELRQVDLRHEATASDHYLSSGLDPLTNGLHATEMSENARLTLRTTLDTNI
jgi:hypothetical protein